MATVHESVGSEVAPAPLDHRKVLVAFSGLLLVMLLAALDSTIVSTALPTIVGELGGLEHLAWVVTAYLLAQTIVTPSTASSVICTAARSFSRSASSSSLLDPRCVA